MKKVLPLLLLGLPVSLAAQQRYLEEIFTDDQIIITPDVSFGVNVDFLTSQLASPNFPTDVGVLQGMVNAQEPIPAPYFDPFDGSTAAKVKDLQMDIYEPDQAVDAVDARPMVLYIHTGNALPPGYPGNGSPNGDRKDSSAVEICKQLAKRGYVAVSMSYRLGWNPIASDLETRRGTLLNAIYRAIHDVRQCVRTHKAVADAGNDYAIDPNKIVVFGEGTGGYISLANATLDKGEELFIEKFVPNPVDFPDVSYVDTVMVGNLDGYGQLSLYRPNGYDYDTHFCVNMGGALADTSWLEPGDVPMVAFHTTFDPFAPFGNGTVIVPTTQEEVVPVSGSNVFMEWVNDYGNNAAFATLPDGEVYTDRARSLYGTVVGEFPGDPPIPGVEINTDLEGLFPMVTPRWPLLQPGQQLQEEASPWQWWDPTSPAALDVLPGGYTCHQASLSSNPNMSGAKARTYIDTVMAYMNPRVVCALELGPCSLVGIEESNVIAQGVNVFPNPSNDVVTLTSSAAKIQRYAVYDLNSRLVRTTTVNAKQAVIAREGLQPGVYFVELFFPEGTVTRKVVLN